MICYTPLLENFMNAILHYMLCSHNAFCIPHFWPTALLKKNMPWRDSMNGSLTIFTPTASEQIKRSISCSYRPQSMTYISEPCVSVRWPRLTSHRFVHRCNPLTPSRVRLQQLPRIPPFQCTSSINHDIYENRIFITTKLQKIPPTKNPPAISRINIT